MTAPARFRQEDVKRAVRGCLAGGMMVGTVRVLPDGTVEVYAEAEGPGAPGGNSVDQILDGKSS